MKFLVDSFDYDFNNTTPILKEDAGGNKRHYITGIFAQAETKNRNGRNYPKFALEGAVKNYTKLITDSRAMGELNHPDHPNVNPREASHLIESLSWDGNNVIGKARILTKLPMGKLVAGLLDEGVKLGVSTRGLGTLVERNGQNVVQNDYIMTAIDIVSDPSAPEAFVNGVMEGREWIFESAIGSWVLAEKIKEVIKKTPSKRLVEAQSKAFEFFLTNLK